MVANKHKKNVQSGNEYSSFMKGWEHGILGKALDDKFTEHPNVLIRGAYNCGVEAGAKVKDAVGAVAATFYGYTPSVLRSVD